MRRSTRWTAATALVGVFALGGFAAAVAQESRPGLDVDALVAELGLNDEQKAELIRLDELPGSQIRNDEEAWGIEDSLSGVLSRLAPGLTEGQLQGLHEALHEQWSWAHMNSRRTGGHGMRMFGGALGCWTGTAGMGTMHHMGAGRWMHGTGVGAWMHGGRSMQRRAPGTGRR